MTLFDQFGREIQVEKRPETREVAVTTVRDRWSSYPSSGLTPETLATIFREADAGDVYRQAELFEEMEEKDTHLFSQLQTRKNAVLGLDYEVSPASDSPEDKKIAQFCKEIIDGLEDFDDALLDMLDAVGKGFSMLEIMWAVNGGNAVATGFSWIHPKRAVFYERSNTMWEKSFEMPRIQTEDEPVNGEIMPPFKLLYHRYKARSGYDTRAGVLRVCAWMYLFKNYAIKDWLAFMEVFGMPIRLGKYDSAASADDKSALVAAIKSLGSDAAGIISKNTEIEFVETVKQSGENNLFENLAKFANAEISKAVLGQTLTTQEGKSGSYSLGQVHDLVRQDLIEADCQAAAKSLRFQLIRPLVGYNFGWDKPVPKFSFKFEAPEDMKMLSEVYKNLKEINFPLTVEHVAERFKVPAPKKGETLLSENGQNAVQKAMKSILANAARSTRRGDLDFSDGLYPLIGKILKKRISGGRFTPDQQALEDLSDMGVRSASGLFAGNEEKILAAVLSAGGYDDAFARILELYPALDAADAADLLERCMINAELFGRHTAGTENDG